MTPEAPAIDPPSGPALAGSAPRASGRLALGLGPRLAPRARGAVAGAYSRPSQPEVAVRAPVSGTVRPVRFRSTRKHLRWPTIPRLVTDKRIARELHRVRLPTTARWQVDGTLRPLWLVGGEAPRWEATRWRRTRASRDMRACVVRTFGRFSTGSRACGHCKLPTCSTSAQHTAGSSTRRAAPGRSRIERSERVAARSVGEVRVGRFPEVVSLEERFDIITFNDVLEHIPDARGALEACRRHLRPRGLLSVNIPTADGLAFRVARGLAAVGFSGPYRRLWQHGLASPHLHYFSTDALLELIRSCGLRVRTIRPLPAVTRTGLWHRVHTVRRPSPTSVPGFACLYAAADLLNRPNFSDIVHVIAERPDD